MSDRRSLRKRCLVLLGLAFLSPLVAFGISNLFLLSPKGRNFIAGKIGSRLHLETSVQGATWSFWNGITVYGLRMEQPGLLREAIARPLLAVQSVQIHPDWPALLRKRLVLKGVDIVKPEIHIPLELLSQIPHQEEMPALAAARPTPAAAPPAAKPLPEAIALNPAPNPPAAATGPSVLEKPPAPEAAAPEDKTPNVWINVRDGRLGVVSLMSGSPLFEASGINGSVPISGKPAKSNISVFRLKGLGEQAPGKIELPLEWTAPVISTKIMDGEMFGIDFKVGGHVGLVKGIPFRIDASAPEQNDRKIRSSGKTIASLGKIAFQGRTEGYLQAPASWQGKWIARTAAVDVNIGDRKNRFDRGQAMVMFQKGALRCLDARLSSEEATIIGNGAILSDGRIAANARIVASPETLASISSLIRRDPNSTHLTPLSTPQRAALDLQIFGYPGNMLYRPDPLAAPIPLR